MSSKYNYLKHFKYLVSVTIALGGAILWHPLKTNATPRLEIKPISWDTIGLDSNKPDVEGPNVFNIGARVCNLGTSAATDVTAKINLGANSTSNTYISVLGLDTLSIKYLPAGGAGSTFHNIGHTGTIPSYCTDFYFNVEILRTTNAHKTYRLYYIEATGKDLNGTSRATIATLQPRRLYIEELIEQNRNTVDKFTGEPKVQNGDIIDYTLTGSTAPGGYEQLVFATNFPNTIFQVIKVSTTYTTPTGTTNNSIYGNACGWDPDPNSSYYLTCDNPLILDDYTGGKVGSNFTTKYKVKILSTQSQTIGVSSLVYDKSGSSYHYNTTYKIPPLSDININVTPATTADLSLTKTVNKSLPNLGENVTFTINVKNDGPDNATNVKVKDLLPAGLTYVSSNTVVTFGSTTPPYLNTSDYSGGFYTSNTGIWDVDTIPKGATATLQIVATVNSSNVITNTAEVSASQQADPDSIPNNNIGTEDDQASVTINQPRVTLSGKVFEDYNYGGGVGRSFNAAQGMAGVDGVNVELYDSSGNFKASTTTSGGGNYSFSNVTLGNYSVRVVNGSIKSTRTGGSTATGLIPVQTFRTNASTGTVQPFTNKVGGEKPNEEDAPVRSGTQTINDLNNLTGKEVQSLTRVQVGSSNVTGLDFGFNFDTIVNTNNIGQGSLSQFITNSNALSNTGLDQVANSIFDPAATEEVSIFMIPSSSDPLGRTADPNFTNGVAVIKLTTLLPVIADAKTTIGGRTQTANIGDTNTGVLGSGGNVGTGNDGRVGTGDEPTLSQVNRPEVQIVDNNGLAIGLDAQANNTTIRGISIYGFGNAANSDANANIRIGNDYTGTLIEQNIIGATATSFTDPGATARSGGDNIRSVGGDTGKVLNNLIGFSAGKGLGIEKTSTGWLVENNEVRGNAIGNPSLDGIDLENSGTKSNTVQNNLFVDNQGVGVDGYSSGGSNTIKNNTITGNGRGSTTAVNETPGVRIYGNDSTIINNLIYDNYGAGVMVENGTSGNKITQNSIYNNGNVTSLAGGAASGQIGIDLLNSTDSAAAGTSPYFTKNDNGDGDTGGNGLLNFPILENATILGGNLILTGFARPGSVIELFIADPDSSGFGEGKTYLVTLTEGSADTDGTTGTYSGLINSLDQGTDTTNRFSFSIPLSQLPGVSANTKLTATATLSNSTSEFSGVTTVTTANANVLLVKRITAINGDRTKNPNDNTPLNLFVDDTTSTRKDDDNDPMWKSGYLLGAIDAGKVKPGDEIEYTVYFLNAGGANANSVRLCDRITANQDFKVNAYGTSKDLQLQLGTSTVLDLTSASDASDRTQLVSAGGTVPSNCYLKAANNNGTLVIDVTGNANTGVPNLTTMPGSTAQATPNDSYGFFRFITKVKP